MKFVIRALLLICFCVFIDQAVCHPGLFDDVANTLPGLPGKEGTFSDLLKKSTGAHVFSFILFIHIKLLQIN